MLEPSLPISCKVDEAVETQEKMDRPSILLVASYPNLDGEVCPIWTASHQCSLV